MTAQNGQDNEISLDGGRTKTGKNKQSFKGIIIGIVIFLIVIIGGCSLISGGCNKSIVSSSPQEQIQEIIAYDHSMSSQALKWADIRQSSINEDVTKCGRLALDYVKEMNKKMQSSQMPDDFRYIYNNHIQAWKEMGELCVDHPHLPTGILDSMWRWITNENPAAIAWYGKAEVADKRIKTTWEEVKNVAATYGVTVDD